MATYIPNITDVFPEPVIYTPDFEFFDKALQKKQQMYEQGIATAKASYDSVLNAPLSDKANITLRDDYLKKAKEDLKRISSADFSIPQNVSAAQNIFSPFWEDNFMLKDVGLTKWYQSQAQKLASWRDSSDPKVREQYNGIAMNYLNNGLEKLQNANRNPDAYSKIEKREAVPFANIQKYLEDAAGSDPDKLKIVWDEQSPDGAYLIKTTNGERSKKKFSTWAESIIGNNFYEQFRVTGKVEHEERAKNIRKTMPNLTDDQVDQLIGTDIINEMDGGYKKRSSNIDVQMKNLQGMLNALPSSLDSRHQQLALALKDQMADLQGKKNALDEEYKYFNQTDKNRIFQNFKQNPDGYFATIAKQRLVDNWATGRASIESKEVKENSAWFSTQNVELRRKELERATASDAWTRQVDTWKQENELWERAHPETKTTTTPKDVTTTGTTTGTVGTTTTIEQDITAPKYIGLGTTGDITKTATTASEVYHKRMDELYLSAHNLIFDTRGLLYLTKSGLGMTDAEIASISSAMKNEISANYDPSAPDYNFTPEQKAATNKLHKALEESEAVKRSGIKLTGPMNFKNALIAYSQDYFNKRLELSKDGNDIPLNEHEFGALMNYMTAVQNLDVYQANEVNRQELVKKVIQKPEYKNIVVDRNGKKDIIIPSDLAKLLPNKDWRINFEGRPLTNLRISELFLQGRLTIPVQHGKVPSTNAGIYIDDKYYLPKPYNNPTGPFAAARLDFGKDEDLLVTNLYNSFYEKYGSGPDLGKTFKKLNDEVVPDLLFYKDKTGKMGVEFSLSFDPKKTGDKAFSVLNEALSPANANMYDEDGNPLDEKTMKALRALLQNKEQNAEKYLQGFTYKTLGLEGKPTISFNIGEISSETKQQIAGVDLDVLNKGTYSLVISPEATGPTLTGLPNNTGMYIYQNLLRGKPMKSDPIISASGFEFNLIPNTDGSTSATGQANTPTKVTVNLKYNIRENSIDPVTKGLVTKIVPKTQDVDIPLEGPNAKSPDEIVSYLYNLYYQTMLNNRNLQQQYEQHLKSNPTINVPSPNGQGGTVTVPASITKDEFFKQNNIPLK